MDKHRPSFPNPGNNNRFPPFYPPPNPHHNHHHHHLPPPPSLRPLSLPPPPPRPPHQSPISLPPFPPPPNSFHHHHHVQFVDQPYRVRQQPLDLNHRHVDFPQAPRRASERLVVVDRRRARPIPQFRRHDDDPSGHAVWEPPPRVPVGATPPPPPPPPPIMRRISRVCFEHEHPSYRPTFQPVDRSRVRKESDSEIWYRIDDLPRERRDSYLRNDNVHTEQRFQRDVDRDIHRKEVEQFSRSIPQEELVVQGKGDGGNDFYEKGKNHVLESDRYGDRDRWEDMQDYNITPRKKQKKKNVLLRIQPALPTYSNTYEHSPDVCDDREPSQFPDYRLSNNERERSPVVLFKSNLLIVGSSNSGAVPDDVSAFRDDKNRNDLLLPSDRNLDNVCEEGPCTFRKEELHFEDKPKSPTLLNKVKSFVSDYLPAPSQRTECLSEDKKVLKSPNGKVLDKSYAASGSGKESSPSFRKKRKVTNPHASRSSSQVLRKDVELIGVDKLVNSLSSKSMFDGGVKDSGKVLTADLDVTESTEIAISASHVKSAAVGSSKTADGKCDAGFLSAGGSSFDEGLTDLGNVGSSKAADGKCDDGFVSTGASLFDAELKDSGKDLSTDVNVTKSTEIALAASHMKSIAVGSSKAADGKCDDDFASAGASLFDEGLKDSRKELTPGVNVTESTEIALTASHMKSTVIGSAKAVDETCANASVSTSVSVFGKGLMDSGKDSTADANVTKSTEIALTASHVKRIAVGSTKAVDATCADASAAAGASAPKKKRKRNRKRRPCSSEQLCGKPVEIQVDGILPTQDVKKPSNSDGIFDKVQKGSSSDMVINYSSNMCLDVVKEASPNQTSASLEDGEIDESMDANPTEQDNNSTQVSVMEEFYVSDASRCNVANTRAVDTVTPQNSGKSIEGCDANAVNATSSLSCMGKLFWSIDAGVSGGLPESEILEGNLSLSSAEGSPTKKDRKRKISELSRGTEKIDASSATLSCSIDFEFAQDKVAGSGLTCPDAQLELHIGDCITTNGSDGRVDSQEVLVSVNPCVSDPSEALTFTCDKKNKVLAPELEPAHGTPTEICKKIASADAFQCDAEVSPCSIQVVPISSVEIGLPVSEIATQSDFAKGLVEETCGKGSSNFELPGTANVSGIPDEKQTSCFSKSERHLQGDGTLLMNGAVDSICGFGTESQGSISDRTASGDCSSQNQCSDQNTGHSETLLVNDYHEPLVRDEECDIDVDILSLGDYPEKSASISMEMFDVSKCNGNSDGMLSSAKTNSSVKSMEAGILSTFSNCSPIDIVNSKLASAADGFANNSGKIISLVRLPQNSNGLQSSSNDRKKQTRVKNELNLTSSKALSSRSSFIAPSSRRPTTVIKSRTWLRTDNTTSTSNLPGQNSSAPFVPQQKQTFSQTVRAPSNSYVRKGNSLLRNPATAVSEVPKTPVPATSVPQLNLSASNDLKKTPSEVPVNLPSPCTIDSSYCNLSASDDLKKTPSEVSVNLPLGDSRFSPVADSPMSTESWPEGFPEDMPNPSGKSEFETNKSLEDQGSLSHSNQAASSSSGMLYIKRKSYQLVAAPNSSTEISASNKDVSMSDVYFKSTKNQLVRATPETNIRQTIVDRVDKGRKVFKSHVSRSAIKRDPNRVSQRIPKSRKASLVWKLCNTPSPRKGVNSVRCQKVLPHLMPWKRATYRRSLFSTSADLFKNSPFSHKLLSSRKPHIIYKRSGFSLRRSKVVSLAGSSLKWSISLERRSKKVDKESNSAVDALEKEKREKAGASAISSLHEGQSRSGTRHLINNAIKPSISRKLRIRNDEYVRIGNGNQLIRNPKKRTRILASEKVRWSLHTARMRLAKKRKYCQFYTRFGKCNKEEGKCPYIHDPSKTAVCTKFLNGLCSDPKCKLTHKVIPERMPDCSFFLHGLCSNESCPYRHVSVNPKAAICESFLKGYCSEGNECRKKHSYICPLYEANGECPEGSKCKLYHRRKGKDKTKKKKNARGRYFGSRRAPGSNEAETVGFKKHLEPKDDGMILEDGALADYISLDVSDEEEEEWEQEDEASMEINLQPSLVLDDDPDELIKPIRLLRIMSRAAQGLA